MTAMVETKEKTKLRHFFDKSERQTLPTSKNGSLATM
jgi:hypothetical protein